MESVAIIKQLRKLKKAECHIRFRQKCCPQGKHLVWSDFFDDKDACNKSVKYNMNLLICLSHEQRKEVYALFYYQVYYMFYKESGMSILNLYDPKLLGQLGLLPDASKQDIKRQLRRLVKDLHPDNGGDKEAFIEMMAAYEKLMDES